MRNEPTQVPPEPTPEAPVSKEVASWLANELRAVAPLARSEEDLRVAAESRLGEALLRLGIPSNPEYERVYANHAGRSDAVYGRVVIEYEAVGALSTAGGVKHAAEQLERYLRAEVEGSSEFNALQRVVGVGLDGYRIFFLRFRGSSMEEPPVYVAPGQGILPLEGDPAMAGSLVPVLDGPYAVDAESIQTFLLYLRAATRSRLSAEGLARQFGPDGPCAQNVVGTLARLFVQSEGQPKVDTFFQEWDRIFGIVYGIDLDTANRHLPILQEAYGLDRSLSLKTVLFSVHTYYALLMKLLAAELVAMQRESLIDSFLSPLPSATDDKLKRAVERVESGDLFAQFAIQNFLEADFFGWYLSVWCSELSDAIRNMVRLLVTFEPATGALDPRPTQDLLKSLYQYLVPREIRHDLGEFYTPNWLADLAIDEAGYDNGLGTRVLDPGCGSGTFLVSMINRVRRQAQADGVSDSDTAHAIVRNLVGFELNPLAVIAARTNYLLALGPLLRSLSLVEIPVYLCDSILAPSVADLGLLGEDYVLRTSAGAFRIPAHVIETPGQLASLTGLMDRCLQDYYSVDEFKAVAAREIADVPELIVSDLANLYSALLVLRNNNRDGIWARIIRNAFAPMTCGLFDFVIGNPPWVNWQSLAPEYRSATLPLWVDYGLFSLRGHAARLGGGKKDLSALMLYRSADSYLRNGGTLAFLITQSLFKSKGAGDGFRRFQLGSGVKLGVNVVHDLTKLQPFEGATTQTALVVLRKGIPTTYPVRYVQWRKSQRIPHMASATLGQVKSACTIVGLAASPIDRGSVSSPWLTASGVVDEAVRDVIGKSRYTAFAGVCTWANGIYWLDIRERTPHGLLRVANRASEALDKNVEQVEALVEAAHVYPLVRSRDIARWRARPSSYMLVPQDPDSRRGIAEAELRVQAPRTYRYLKGFEGALSVRSGMLKYFDASKGDAFYSVYNVSGGTFAPYKVMWRQMVPTITAAVLGPFTDPFLGYISPVTQHVVSVIATETAEEAHYVCAMLNSSVATSISASYSTGKSYGTPSMLHYVPVPKFDPEANSHARLAALSVLAHDLAAEDRPTNDVQDAVDQEAAALFGVESRFLPDLGALVAGLRRRVEPELDLSGT
jgi:methylase of polypeptide subunit release factors